MIDRLISGAGAISARVDDLVRGLFRARGRMAVQPVSTIIAGAAGLLAVVLVAAGLEAGGPRTPWVTTPSAIVAAGEDLGRRFVTLSGVLPGAFVETFIDTDFDGELDPDEPVEAWDYFLVDLDTGSAVTVHSERPPHLVYTFTASGVVVDDPVYIEEGRDHYALELEALGVTLESSRYVDATGHDPVAPGHPLGSDLPPAGSAVTVSGSRTVTFLSVCPDAPPDTWCEDGAIEAHDLVVFDPDSGRGVLVRTGRSPEYTPATFTGMIRRDARAVGSTIDADPTIIEEYGLTISRSHLLIDGVAPAEPALLFILAAALVALAGAILVGVAGRYLVFRPTSAVPTPARSMAVGASIPVRVTGILRGRDGSAHVRSAPARLTRYGLVDGVDGAPPEAIGPDASTLIVERDGRPEGVAVGREELRILQVGDVVPLTGRRPGLRLQAGTGRLLLAFATPEDRAVAAAELAAELAMGQEAGPTGVPAEGSEGGG